MRLVFRGTSLLCFLGLAVLWQCHGQETQDVDVVSESPDKIAHNETQKLLLIIKDLEARVEKTEKSYKTKLEQLQSSLQKDLRTAQKSVELCRRNMEGVKQELTQCTEDLTEKSLVDDTLNVCQQESMKAQAELQRTRKSLTAQTETLTQQNTELLARHESQKTESARVLATCEARVLKEEARRKETERLLASNTSTLSTCMPYLLLQKDISMIRHEMARVGSLIVVNYPWLSTTDATMRVRHWFTDVVKDMHQRWALFNTQCAVVLREKGVDKYIHVTFGAVSSGFNGMMVLWSHVQRSSFWLQVQHARWSLLQWGWRAARDTHVLVSTLYVKKLEDLRPRHALLYEMLTVKPLRVYVMLGLFMLIALSLVSWLITVLRWMLCMVKWVLWRLCCRRKCMKRCGKKRLPNCSERTKKEPSLSAPTPPVKPQATKSQQQQQHMEETKSSASFTKSGKNSHNRSGRK